MLGRPERPDFMTIKLWRAEPLTSGQIFFYLLCLWFALLALFHFVPSLDIYTSRLFYTQNPCPNPKQLPATCGGFDLPAMRGLAITRKVLFYLPSVLALVIFVMLLAALRHRGEARYSSWICRLRTAILSFVLGPYLLVNIVMKSIWGRARPYDTDIFAGDMPFTPAGMLSSNCERNCSFVSGEAAGAGWILCLALLLPAHLRPYLVPPLLAASIATPALRVTFGAHYLSDVVLGWVLSLVVFFGVLALSEQHRDKKIRKLT